MNEINYNEYSYNDLIDIILENKNNKLSFELLNEYSFYDLIETINELNELNL